MATDRKCIYCGTPIAQCMGSVLPRDVLLILEDKAPPGFRARELCNTNFACQERWKKEVKQEVADARS